MIIPEDLTLEELIGSLKVEIRTLTSTSPGTSNEVFNLATQLNILEIVKRELDKKQDKETK